MRLVPKALLAFVVVLALASCTDIGLKAIVKQEVSQSGPIKVGSVADARFSNGGWTLDGVQMVHARSKLLNTANFGAGGTVKRTITITDTTATITASLLSSFDVFFIGYMPNVPGFGAGEITAMQNWVSSGGVMIVTADDETDNQVAAAFGYGMTTHFSPGVTAPLGAGTTHPVFVGPFGTASAINGAGFAGLFTGNVTGQLLLGWDAANLKWTVIEIPYGSGRVLILADVDYLSDDSGMTANNTINPVNGNDVFLGNVFAYEHK